MNCEKKEEVVFGYGDGSTQDGRRGKICGFDKGKKREDMFYIRIEPDNKENQAGSRSQK